MDIFISAEATIPDGTGDRYDRAGLFNRTAAGRPLKCIYQVSKKPGQARLFDIAPAVSTT
jgi:hypothetical protein